MPILKITTEGGATERHFEGAPLLSEVAALVETPCGGKGVCLKCRVRASGAVSAPTRSELDAFNEAELSGGARLACQTRLLGDAEVSFEKDRALRNIETLGEVPPFIPRPMDGRLAVCVDIGTTTVALCVVSLETCEVLSTASEKNPQAIVAADVIGRIEKALNGESGRLKSLIEESIARLTDEAQAKAGLGPEDIDRYVITGNTTMLYLLTGRSPKTLSHAPFDADCLFDMWVKNAYLPACFSAFVGADIVCAVLASGMCERTETSLLIDIGTNGEIALWHRGTLYCCATAAGPAFEGGGICAGTGSIAGAIDSVRAVDGKLEATTIQGERACGICGSGVLDATAALLSLDLLDETGSLCEDQHLRDGIFITQADIRAVQLAKGAIAAGIKTLCSHVGVEFEKIAALFIAGGFGKYLNLKSAVKIGMIPPELKERAIVLGNAALTGAALLSLDKENLPRSRELVKKAVTVPLGGSSEFANNFMELMMLEEM